MIVIANDGQNIRSTNFWDSELNTAGKYYLSFNANALRIMLPDTLTHYLNEMRTGNKVEIEKQETQIVVWFIDGTESPFRIASSFDAIDRLWTVADVGKSVQVLVYTRGPTLELRLDGKILNY